jgi:hypothetical protein
MSYALDTKIAKSADALSASIRETGKYIGTITRAEAIKSTNGTTGLGLSFKADDGATADYLDLWTHRSNGEALSSLKTVNALLACAKLRSINQGPIHFEKWNKDAKQREKVQGTGYPELMGKRIGFLLRKELETDQHGEDRERVGIFAIFQADTELTATEVLDQKTKPERLSKMFDALMARPVNDKRKSAQNRPAQHGAPAGRPAPAGTGFDDMDDDIPF